MSRLVSKLRTLYSRTSGWAMYEEVRSESGATQEGSRRADGIAASIWW